MIFLTLIQTSDRVQTLTCLLVKDDCCTEALINGGSQKDLEGEGFVVATDTQHLYLSSTFFSVSCSVLGVKMLA